MPILKKDETIILCSDYKVTVIKVATVDTYAITRLDMRHAYEQLHLDRESRKCVL